DPTNLYRRKAEDSLVNFNNWKQIIVAWHQGENLIKIEGKLKTYSGFVKDTIKVYSVIPDEENSRTHILLGQIDITDRKASEIALKESEEQFRSLFEQSHNAIIITSPINLPIKMNQAGIELFGYTLEELCEQELTVIYHDKHDRKRLFDERNKNGFVKNMETKAKRKDGQILDVIINSIPRYDIWGNVIEYQNIIHDVTDIKQAEQSLLNTQEILQTVISNAPIVLWALNTDGVFTLSEGNALKEIGLQPGQLVGQSIYTVYKDHSDIISANREALTGKPISYLTQVDNIYFESHVVPQFDDNGKVVGTTGIASDITNIKLAELEIQTTREQLFQSQKMEAIGRIAGGIAHDFKL
ncbi:MAG: PAS domain S-box protein, partial [Candidatus Kariarchaeaceae archaeon]